MDDHHHHHQSTISITHKPHHQDRIHGLPKKPRSFRAMHIIRVALYMLKSGKSKPTKHDHKSTSAWKKLVGSMRPFHHVHDSNYSPPRLAQPDPDTRQVDEQLEVFTPPLSPAKDSRASSSCDRSSRYASAANLQELDQCDESKEEEGVFDEDGGDEMIDVKAELFIAQFYQQMRLQRQAYATRA